VLVFVLELECARRAQRGPLAGADRGSPFEEFRPSLGARHPKLSYDRQRLLNLHAFCPRAR